MKNCAFFHALRFAKKSLLRGVLVLWVGALGFGCQGRGCENRPEVVVYTSVDMVFSAPIFRYCEQQTGLRVKAVFDTEETKSTGVLNRLLAESKTPQADVFWSGDPVRPFSLLTRGMVQSYHPKNAKDIPEAFKDGNGHWTGFAARARVLLLNTKLVDPKQVRSIEDLANPRWKGRVTIANPVYGTTTMHMAALFVHWGEQRTRQFLAALKQNDVRIASSNGEVKRLVVAGEMAIGLTDTDDAYEARKASRDIAVVYPDQQGIGTLLMPTTAVLLKRSPHPPQGRQLLDCLLSRQVEQQMAQIAAHMPLRKGIETPQEIRQITDLKVMQVDYAKVSATMEKIHPWLRTWVGI